jgi:hypothetical protein
LQSGQFLEDDDSQPVSQSQSAHHSAQSAALGQSVHRQLMGAYS